MNGLEFRDRTEEEDAQQERPNAPAINGRQVVVDAFLRSTGNPALMAGAAIAQDPEIAYDQVTNFRYGRYRDNTRSSITALGDIYDDADDEIFRITGQRLGNPLIADGIGDYFNREIINTSGTGTDRYASTVNDPRMQWHAELARLAASDPRLAEIQRRYADRTRVDALAAQLREQATREYHEYLGDDDPVNQLIRGVLGAPGMIAGGLSSGSPEQIAQLAAGGGSRGMTLTERAISGALSNVVGQAAVEPALIEDARRMGEEYSSEQIALDFIIAAGFGATIDVAGGVLDNRTQTPIEPGTPPLRERAALPLATDDVTDVPGGDIQRALTGQAESLIVSAYSRDAATARTFPDPDQTDPIALADYINAADRFINGESDQFPVEARPVRVADEAEVSAARAAADDTPAPDPGTVETIRFGGQERRRTFMRFDPRELGADPETFQYKRAQGADGVTGVLEGVEVFDPASAGKVKVFEYADGRRVIADGHQRRALARAALQSGQDNVWLDGYLYRAEDGWTPREVRNLAAQKNLRETPGDPIDTAQLIREAPELIDSSVPQRSQGFRVASGLAKLSDAAFAAVRAGVVDPRHAATIGEIASARPEIHEPLVSMFQQQPPRSVREASFIVHEAMQAEVFRTQAAQLSMFGDAPELAGMRERAEILRISGNILRNDKRLFDVAARNAEALESAGNIIRKEENERRADAAEALLRSLDSLATRPSAVSRLLREIAETAAREKIKPDVAADRFVTGLVDLLNERGLIGLLQERPPEIDPPKPIDTPMLPRLEEEARAADLLTAHDADDEAFRQALAEIAVERALRGDMDDMPEPDAIGHTPEADMRRIEAALDALGIDDPTVPDVALALYARATADMETAARARLRGDVAGDAPATHAEAVEQNAKIEVWNPLDFEEEDKLIAAIESATIPQLDKIQRTFPVGDGNARTRAEFMAQFTQEWRDVNGVEPPPPVVSVKRPAPSSLEMRDLINRAARFVGREDAVQRYADARADLIDAIDRMGDKGDKWLARAIEDMPLGPRKKVLREVERARSGQFAKDKRYLGDRVAAEFSDEYAAERASEALDAFEGEWKIFIEELDDLRKLTNELPSGVTEPIDGIAKIMSRLSGQSETLIRETRAARDAFAAWEKEHGGWLDQQTYEGSDDQRYPLRLLYDELMQSYENDLSETATLRSAIDGGEDIEPAFNDFDSSSRELWDGEDGAANPPALTALIDILDNAVSDGLIRNARANFEEALPLFAQMRRNLDELWDEWQSVFGSQIDEAGGPLGLNKIEGADRAFARVDSQLNDVIGAFDGAGMDHGGLRVHSRPRGVRFAIGDAAPPRAPKNTVANVIRQVQREFPRYGKKLLERGRLTVVQSANELPDGGRGLYARLFDAAKGPAERASLSDALESIRISEGEGLGLTDIYAWRSSAGRAMAAEVVAMDPRAPAIVNFGILKPGGVQVIDAEVGEGLANAIETLSMAMAALDRDAAQFNRPSYRFAGLTPKHRQLYARMFSSVDPPVGYVKVRVVSDSGMDAGIAVVRADIAKENGLEGGGSYNQPQINKLFPPTRMPRSAALTEKQQALSEARFDLIEGVQEKLQSPPRRGAFALGNGTLGYSEGGQSWLVADNLAPELVRGITLHEVGEHVGMPEMLGEAGYERFLMDAQKLYAAGDADIVSGYNIAIKRGVPESQIWSEAVAYALTYADPNQMSDGFRGFVMRLINSVRAWAWRTFPWMRDLDRALTFEDMQFLAMGALRHASRNDPRVIDTRSIPTRLRDLARPKPRALADAVAEAESGWLPTRVYHGKSGRPQNGMMFTTPDAKIAGLYGEIEAYEVRGPIYDASDDVVRTQDDFNRLVAEAQRSGANGVYIRALDRGKFGAQEQIVMFNGEAVRPAGSGRVDPNNPASVARAEAERLDRVVTMLEHCR